MHSSRPRGFRRSFNVLSALAVAAAAHGLSGCSPDEGDATSGTALQKRTANATGQTPNDLRPTDSLQSGSGTVLVDPAAALVETGDDADAARIASTGSHRTVSAEQPDGGTAEPGGDILVEAMQENGGDLSAALEKVAVRVQRGRFGDVVLVNLTGPRITDAALERIKTLDSLLVLDVWKAPVTDEGVAHLAGMTQLRALGLRQTKVTDAGLEHLAGLTSLEELNLTGTAVTDAGMRHLAGLMQLRALGLDDTAVMPGGVNELQVALPLCRIAW